MIEEFERHLRGTNLSENTISSYLFALRQYSSQYDGITKKNLRAYKVWLIENYKPKTVNLRLRAINCYLESVGKESWKMPFVRVQQKAFLENVISEADYEYFKTCLKRDDELFWYFVIRFLAATGARVSELIQIKVEHIKLRSMRFPSKETVERIRKEYPVGTRVELVQMDDPQAPPVGTKGTVRGVDDIGSIMVAWDNGCGLSVAYGEDICRKLL